MLRQIRLLTGVSLRGMFGLNEFRYTKDRRKKVRYCLFGVLCVFVILMLAAYAGGVSYGLILLKLGYYVPAVMAVCGSLVIFFFTMMKAGPILFDLKAYEKQAALPVTPRAIIASRFLSMYVTNLLFGILLMVPGLAVYAVMEKPGFLFWLYASAGILFLPLLPLTAASVAGALISGISSRWRQKNLAGILLTMLFVCVILAGSFGLSGVDERQMEKMLLDAAPLLAGQIGSFYPPALWLSEAVAGGKGAYLLLFLAVSLGCFLVFLGVLGRVYGKICSLLAAHEASGDYRMTGLRTRSVQGSMVERELRRYFSSTVYVTNTLVGAVMMVLFSAGVLIAGKEMVDQIIHIPGLAERALPVLIGMMPAMMPMTSCSISMEGKQWWILQTMPVTEKEIVRGKVLANILVLIPFYLVSEILILIALAPDIPGALALIVVPAVYIVFSARLGVAVNQRFPVFEWDNEARVVKQSASTSVSLLLGLVTGVIPFAFLVLQPDIPAWGIYGVFTGVLILLTAVMEFR